MTKAVLFDIDGTLLDSVDLHAQAWQEALERYGVRVPYAQVRAQIGKGGDQLLPVFFSKEDLERRGEEIEAYRSKLFKDRYLPQVRPFPGVRDLFERLRRQGTRLVLASSGKADEVEYYRKLADIDDLVDAATSSDDVERSKPCPDIFAAALAQVAPIGAGEAVAVGDTPYDAEAARKVGLTVVGVRCGGFPEAELRAAGCAAIFDGPEDLLANLERSPLAARAPAEP